MSGASLLAAPMAGADPSDLVPTCQGDESPQNDNCSTPCPEGAPVDSGGACSEPGTQAITGGPADEFDGA